MTTWSAASVKREIYMRQKGKNGKNKGLRERMKNECERVKEKGKEKKI